MFPCLRATDFADYKGTTPHLTHVSGSRFRVAPAVSDRRAETAASHAKQRRPTSAVLVKPLAI